MNRKMNLTIGGKEVTLNFGANWFYEFYKEDSGHDLVKDPGLTLVDLESFAVFPYIQSMIWAGYQTECAISRKEPELSRDDVKHFVMSGAGVEIVWDLLAAASGITVEELRKKAETPEKKN